MEIRAELVITNFLHCASSAPLEVGKLIQFSLSIIVFLRSVQSNTNDDDDAPKTHTFLKYTLH